jgi:hypothetical protein
LKAISDLNVRGNSRPKSTQSNGEKRLAKYDNVDEFYKVIPSMSSELLDPVFKGFSKVFYSFKAIKVTIPTFGWFSPQNTWIREKTIPIFQGKIDWRLLDGDGGDPNGRTESVEKLLENIEKEDEYEVKIPIICLECPDVANQRLFLILQRRNMLFFWISSKMEGQKIFRT